MTGIILTPQPRGHSPMKIVLLEHFTSSAGPATGSRGAVAGRRLRAEGAAMRDALADDLIRLGDVEVAILLPPGIVPEAGLRRVQRLAAPKSLRLVPVHGSR